MSISKHILDVRTANYNKDIKYDVVNLKKQGCKLKMVDERLKTLAKNLINYSCSLKKGENILIEAMDTDEEFLCELVKERMNSKMQGMCNIVIIILFLIENTLKHG